MEKLILKSLLGLTLILSAGVLSACAGAEELESPTGLDSYITITGAFSQEDETTLSGTGIVRFETGLTSDHQDISLKADLDSLNAGSYVGVVFNSSSAIIPTNNGIFIKFLRQGASVITTISVNGNDRLVTSSRATYLLPNALNLVIQFFNSPSPRVIVWQGDSTVYGISTAIIDTANVTDISSPLPVTPGPGHLAGLHLNFATVTAARIGDGKVILP